MHQNPLCKMFTGNSAQTTTVVNTCKFIFGKRKNRINLGKSKKTILTLICGGPRSDLTVKTTERFLLSASSCTSETGDFTSEFSMSAAADESDPAASVGFAVRKINF